VPVGLVASVLEQLTTELAFLEPLEQVPYSTELQPLAGVMEVHTPQATAATVALVAGADLTIFQVVLLLRLGKETRVALRFTTLVAYMVLVAEVALAVPGQVLPHLMVVRHRLVHYLGLLFITQGAAVADQDLAVHRHMD
jgi:hypothetical protein